jgi:CRP/FNR family cyclic AMP-dependent transcriptional regulator
MSEDNALAAVRAAPAFSGLSTEQTAEIARNAKRLKFMRGDIITRGGQIGDSAYLIISGAAEEVQGAASSAQKRPVDAGSLIGEMAMLIEHTFTATVVANDWVHCLKITRAALHAQMLADPTLAEHFHRRVSSRLTQIMEELRRIEGTVPGAVQSPPPQAAAAAPGPQRQRA